MMRRTICIMYSLLLVYTSLNADNFRTILAKTISVEYADTASFELAYTEAALIQLLADPRFVQGIEISIQVPASYMQYRGSLAASLYTNLQTVPSPGVADIQARQLHIEPLANKLQTAWQIPLRKAHDLRSSPYVTLIQSVLTRDNFPLLLRMFPVIKGLSNDIESMRFTIGIKIIPSNEGLLTIQARFPEHLPDKPFTLLLDGNPIQQNQEILLKAGEYHLTLSSENYRNISKRVVIQSGATSKLVLELQDPAPLVRLEAPENALIYFDDVLIEDPKKEFTTQPGQHELRFSLGDYTITRVLQLQKGKSYTIAMMVDMTVSESE